VTPSQGSGGGGGGGGGAATHCPLASQVSSAVQQVVPHGVVPSAQLDAAEHRPLASQKVWLAPQQVTAPPSEPSSKVQQAPPLGQQPANTPVR